MKILLTGATGYIGRRLLPVLVEEGHQVVCLVRDKSRFDFDEFTEEFLRQIAVHEADLNDSGSLASLPADIDVAYYLVHSLATGQRNFGELEATSARNFAGYLRRTAARQVIYLGGIANDENLSDHLASRKNVENILRESGLPVTVLRAAIIIGSGSASFEIIRDLVEKLPVMIGPQWLKSRCQPIAIRNVVEYLTKVKDTPACVGETFDIGGPDILSYRDMLLGFARVRKLRRWIIQVPVLSPRLSSLWLLFVTSTSYQLARNLVNSLKNEVVCRDERIQDFVSIKLVNYETALRLAFDKINQKNVVSSWTDAVSSHHFNKSLSNYIQVPDHGCYRDRQAVSFKKDKEAVLNNIWSIGGDRGWYFGNWMWRIRGLADKAVGGVGLRRGRRSPTELKAGDALDFWRVLLADKQHGRLLLYAEMKLPGEAWLEFHVKQTDHHHTLVQTATFRPLGIWGRLYWYCLLPFHFLIFPQMARNIVGH